MFDIYRLSPVQIVNGIWVKRNDLFDLNGEVNGSKACGAWYLIQNELKKRPIKGVITMGSRTSPQCNIVSCICQVLGIEAHLFMSDSKEKTDIQKKILSRRGSTIHYVKMGYQSVINARAREYAVEHPEFLFLPFGLESDVVSDFLSEQCQNIPESVKHITITIGGGNNFVALLKGLYKYRPDIKVTGILIGGENAVKYIQQRTPLDVSLKIDYDIKTYRPDLNPMKRYLMQEDKKLDDIKLHPTYEAKCFDFIRFDLGLKEMFWIIGG